MTTAVLAAKRRLQQRERRVLPFVLITALAGGALLGGAAIDLLSRAPAWQAALTASLFTALATGAGALPVLFVGRMSARHESALLGLSGGIMLAAAAFSLAAPALQLGSPLIVGLGITLGAATMLAIDHALPHTHAEGIGEEGTTGLGGLGLVVLAIALHNVPEGLAVGVAHADGHAQGTAVTLGIAAQNLPEGLVVAWAARLFGRGRSASVLIALATGLMEPLGALVGVALLGISSTLLPWGLAFAAGAMLFVVSHEIIPASHRRGHESHATTGVTLGFAGMLLLTGVLV